MENLTQKINGKFTTPYQPASAGEYKVRMIHSEIVPTKAGKAVKATFEIVDGERGVKVDSTGKVTPGTKIFKYFNIEHPNLKTVDISNKEIDKLLLVTKSGSTLSDIGNDYGSLMNLAGQVPFIAVIDINEYTAKDGTLKKSNNIKYFKTK